MNRLNLIGSLRRLRLSSALLAGALALGLVAASVSEVEAQGGALEVRVASEGLPIEDATVNVVFMGRLLHRAGTNEQGVMTISALPAGTFTVRVEALGHAPYLNESVRVDLGTRVVLEVDLETQAIELEGITVQSERTRIERENTEFSTRIDDVAIKMLPLAHDAREIVALTPGARAGHVWGGANFQANSYRIDGLSANHPGMGGDLLQPSVSWIDEIHVRGLGAGAEYGGFQGGLIDVVTKRGTNVFEGMFRTNFENGALNASNLGRTESGLEVASRYDVEAEVRGPLIENVLHYYLSGTRIEQSQETLNHLRQFEDRLAPIAEERVEHKLFGKVNWAPQPRHELTVSGAYTDVTADNYSLSGYEAPGAGWHYTSPTWFLNASWRSFIGEFGVIEARANHFSNDERYDSYQGEDVPGISTFALTPPYNAYLNNPYTLRSAPTSSAVGVTGTFRLPIGSAEQVLRVGVEHTRGSFLNRRIRNGDLTWLPTNSGSFVPEDPDTWNSFSWVPTQWGGEVNLDADVQNTSAFAQTALNLGPRLVLTPGLRWNQWKGFLTPRAGERFQAVQDQAIDPRIGVSFALDRDATFVLKGHWGHFHQDLVSQMFDRAAGSDVFTDEEVWYYWGEPFTDPATSFTEAERDALAEQGIFRRESVVAYNETGRVENYKQPYIEQWLVAVEKQFGYGVKMEALYTRRSNRNMVALVDRNWASNYTHFPRVRVFDGNNVLLPFSGGSVFLDEVYLPNDRVIERLRFCAANTDVCGPIPNMQFSDTLGLTWNPDNVLTTAPDATREFGQFQFTLEVAQPLWGASVSFVVTDLKGNLDNVTGYVDPNQLSPGPYVWVNEGVNAYGTLENFADKELKVSAWGNLGERTRVGAFWTWRTGDHYSPRLRLSGWGFSRYRVNTGPAVMGSGGGITLTDIGDELPLSLFQGVEGQHVFVGPRGKPTMQRRGNIDVRVEHMLDMRGSEIGLSLEVFNLFGDEAVTDLQTMVNNGPDYWYYLRDQLPPTGVPANEYYQAPKERTRPRSLRLGMAVYF